MKKKNILGGILIFVCLFIFFGSVDAESISGYTATVEEVKSGNAVFGDSSGIKTVTTTSESSAYFQYTISGLDKNKIYTVKADFKTENVTGNGGIIGIVRDDNSAFYNFAFSKGVSGTNDWDEQTLVFTSNEQGVAKLIFGFGYNYGDYGFSKGTLNFKNIRITDASNESSLLIGESKNKKVKMVVWKKDYDSVGITSTQFQTYLDRIEVMYDTFVELVGNSSHGTLYPYNSKQVVYMITNYHQYGALAGFPIEMNATYAIDHLNAAKTSNKIPWTILHETGHLFDLALSNKNNSYSTSAKRYSKDAEQSASFYPLYVMEKMNLITDDNLNYDGWVNKYKTTYGTTLANGTWNGDAFSYMLTKIQKNGKVDWDAFKNTYKWFNDLSSSNFSNNVNNQTDLKIMWYLKKLDDFSDMNVRSLFKENELKAILGSYKPFNSVNINVGEQNAVLNDSYKLSPETSGDSFDVLVYESSDSSAAEVDDFGNVKLKSTSKGSVTITVRSFLDSSKKDSYTFKILSKDGNGDNNNNDDNKDKPNPDDGNKDNDSSNGDHDKDLSDENKDQKDDKPNNTVENPKTAVVNSVVSIVIVIAICVIGLKYIDKRKVFKIFK